MVKKKSLLFTVVVFIVTLTLALTACVNEQKPSGPVPDKDHTTQEPIYALSVFGDESRTMEVDEVDTLDFAVTKDNVALTGTELFDIIEAVITGDSISFNSRTKQVTALSAGKASVTLSLKGHNEVAPVTINYVVSKALWSNSLRRGDVKTSGANASFTTSGQQPMIAMADSSTDFIFKGKVNVANFEGGQSFGIASFVDAGDTALWIGLRNDNNQPDGKYSVYIRNFYNGWGNATTDKTVEGYTNLDFNSGDISFELVRMGNEYRYDINGYYGVYTDETNYAGATNPGFFMQEHTMDMTNCVYITDKAQVAERFNSYDSRKAALFTLNESGVEVGIVRGWTYNFEYNVYPQGRPIDLVWSLDKAGMTAGETETTIENGVLKVASNAEGTLVVNVTDGNIEEKVTVRVLDKPAENDLLTLKGGVVLNQDGSITFPKEHIGINGVGNETAYEDNAYSAYIKQKVIGNFSIKFTVSNYFTEATFPKLMVSLGGVHEQFYVVYKPDGTCRIETFTEGLKEDGGIISLGGSWNNSATFENFDPTKPHTFEIVVKDGIYSVYLDDEARTSPLKFAMDNTACTLIRRAEDMGEQPIRISTNGVAATVSDIVITNGTAADIKDFYSYSKEVNDITSDSFVMTMGNHSWGGKELTRITKSELLATDFDISFKLAFSNVMTDAKFITTIGGVDIIINNKPNGLSATVNGVGQDWQDTAYEVSEGASNLEIDVRISRVGNNLKVYFGNQLMKDITHDAIANGTHMYFWEFNENPAENTTTATVTGLKVTTPAV